MISISLSDIIAAMKLEEGHNYSEMQLLHPDTDDLVLQYARDFGLNDKEGYCFTYNRHRNLQNKVVEGFRIIGEIRRDRAFLNSPFCGVEDRAIAAAHADIGFAKELFSMMGSRVSYGTLDEDANDIEPSSATSNVKDADDAFTKQIESYNDICFSIRGTPYNEFGNLKNYAEWQVGV